MLGPRIKLLALLLTPAVLCADAVIAASGSGSIACFPEHNAPYQYQLNVALTGVDSQGNPVNANIGGSFEFMNSCPASMPSPIYVERDGSISQIYGDVNYLGADYQIGQIAAGVFQNSGFFTVDQDVVTFRLIQGDTGPVILELEGWLGNSPERSGPDPSGFSDIPFTVVSTPEPVTSILMGFPTLLLLLRMRKNQSQ